MIASGCLLSDSMICWQSRSKELIRLASNPSNLPASRYCWSLKCGHICRKCLRTVRFNRRSLRCVPLSFCNCCSLQRNFSGFMCRKRGMS